MYDEKQQQIFGIASQVAASNECMVLTRGQSYRQIFVVPQGPLRDANATGFGTQFIEDLQKHRIVVQSVRATRAPGWDIIHTRDVDIWLLRDPQQEPSQVTAVNTSGMQSLGFAAFLLWMLGLVVAPGWAKVLCFLLVPSFYFAIEFLVKVLTNVQ